jgi:hypothetical protein
VNRDKLLTAINEKLDASRIKDACPNGLQVEGREEVSKVIISVSASEKLFKEAAAQKADMIIVHHGLFWNNASRVVRGSMKTRLNTCQNDITLADTIFRSINIVNLAITFSWLTTGTRKYHHLRLQGVDIVGLGTLLKDFPDDFKRKLKISVR